MPRSPVQQEKDTYRGYTHPQSVLQTREKSLKLHFDFTNWFYKLILQIDFDEIHEHIYLFFEINHKYDKVQF